MGRTLIISDVHLPRGRMDASRPLAALLEQCDRLVVNGDLAELHHPGLAAESRRHLGELKADAEALGTELELLGGNHDPEITPLRALGFAENRVIVTHGDAFTSRIAPWSRHAALLEQAWLEARDAQGNEIETVEDRFDAARAAAMAEWTLESECPTFSTPLSILVKPRAIIHILDYWRRANRLARDFASSFFPKAEILVVGHTHRAQVSLGARPTVINTGAFQSPARPRAVVLEGHRLRVVPVRRREGRWTAEVERTIYEAEIRDSELISGRWGLPERSTGG